MGGFFKKPFKAIVGAVSKYVPGGKYLTGREVERQKFHYNAALNEYNNYTSEAQRNIDNFSHQLNESMGRLQSIEQQKQHHAQNSYQLQSHVDRYQQGMQSLEQHKMNLGNEANALHAVFENFKSKAPQLAGKISEIQKLPVNFQQMFEGVTQQKERLRGLTEDEAGGRLAKYHQSVEDLKKHRQETENNIRKQLDEITQQHSGLSSERANLENRLHSYSQVQNRLLGETEHFNNTRSQLENIIKNYQNEGQRLDNEYRGYQSQAESLNNQLNSYSSNAQTHLDNLANTANFRAGKLKKASFNTGALRGLALTALTFGAGSLLTPAVAAGGTTGAAASASGVAASGATTFGSSLLGSLGSGLKFIAPMAGIAAYMGAMNRTKGLGGLERTNLRENIRDHSNSLAATIGNKGFSYDKIGLPELGGLKQSLSHFNMPSIPKVQDLPKLSESLGKITALGDLENLSLGLPQMTSADGKKYSSEVLYDMDFLKKLKKVSKNLGVPYLRGAGSNIRGNIAYA